MVMTRLLKRRSPLVTRIPGSSIPCKGTQNGGVRCGPLLGFEKSKCGLGRFTKYKDPIHTLESNLQKGSGSVTISLVYDRIPRILNVASHPLSLGRVDDAPVLFKFHNCVGDIGFPTDDTVVDGNVCAMERQPGGEPEASGAPFIGSGCEAARDQIFLRRFGVVVAAVGSDKDLVRIHPKMTLVNDSGTKPELFQRVGSLVSPCCVVKPANFEIHGRIGSGFPRSSILNAFRRRVC